MNKNKHSPSTNSKRSIRSGPINPHDARYHRNEKSIHRSLEKALSHRRINLRACEISEQANITSSTLYLHCRSSDDALRTYERNLIADFHQSIQQTPNPPREVIFIVLLNFIQRHHSYFSATLVQDNCWMVARLLQDVRSNLVSTRINDKCFDTYAGHLTTIIFCWGKHEHFASARIPFYTKKLLQTRIIDLGL